MTSFPCCDSTVVTPLPPAASIQSSDDEFEDAADDFGSHFTVAVPTNHKRTASNVSQVRVERVLTLLLLLLLPPLHFSEV